VIQSEGTRERERMAILRSRRKAMIVLHFGRFVRRLAA
jgi:hypothetical protein